MRDTTEANGTSDIFKALADPTRRQILQDLTHGELAAGEFTVKFPMSGPSISRHLSVLKGAGLVTERRDSNRILYTLVEDRLALSVGEFLSTVCPQQIVLRLVRNPKRHQPKRLQHGQHSGVGVTIRIPALSATIERRLLINYRRGPAPCDLRRSTGLGFPLRSAGAKRTPPTASQWNGMTHTALTRHLGAAATQRILAGRRRRRTYLPRSA